MRVEGGLLWCCMWRGGEFVVAFDVGEVWVEGCPLWCCVWKGEVRVEGGLL